MVLVSSPCACSDARSQSQIRRECLKNSFYTGNLMDKKVFSQVGEDGIVEATFACLKPTTKDFVEFGVEAGTECITRLLREESNWTGIGPCHPFDRAHPWPSVPLPFMRVL